MAQKHQEHVKENPNVIDPVEEENWISGKKMEELFGSTLIKKDRSKVSTSKALGGRVVAIYFRFNKFPLFFFFSNLKILISHHLLDKCSLVSSM